MKYFVFLVLLNSVSLGQARSLGVVGAIFPIKEKSFLQLIHERLKAFDSQGTLNQLNQKWVNRVALHANRPPPLNISRTNEHRKHYYHPELVLVDDIKDHKGRVLYSKGTRINALERLPSYQPCWLFFNADDEAQMLWAKNSKERCTNPKYILTRGAIKDAERVLDSAVYFDQEGRITQKLHIGAVPSQVMRSGNQLVIDEFAIKESGDEI